MVTQKPTFRLLGVEAEKPAASAARWRVIFEIWPGKDPYSVFLARDVADENIVRLARQQLADEFAALAKALGA